VGISFFTFESMSYVIDVYRGHIKPQKSYCSTLSFVAFFPHLVAGQSCGRAICCRSWRAYRAGAPARAAKACS
jgi:hypothetical protein